MKWSPLTTMANAEQIFFQLEKASRVTIKDWSISRKLRATGESNETGVECHQNLDPVKQQVILKER
jgi:hypothetical protein